MTITNGYLTEAEAVAATGVNATADRAVLGEQVEAVSRMIDDICGRSFYQTASQARVFEADCARELEFGPFNDVVSVSSLKVDQDGDGVFETTISSSDYQLGELNAAVQGWPYEELCLLNSATFPLYAASGREGLVQITGVYGWPAVPSGVKAAARLLLNELVKLKDAPFGVAGATDVGVAYVRSNLPARVPDLLDRYIHPHWFGIA